MPPHTHGSIVCGAAVAELFEQHEAKFGDVALTSAWFILDFGVKNGLLESAATHAGLSYYTIPM